MDAKFLKAVQQSGWVVESATEDEAICRCANGGCQLRAKLRRGTSIPVTDVGYRGLAFERPVSSLQEWVDLLRQRRQELGLTIKDVEEIIGGATDSVAKYESEISPKIPPVEFMFLWSQALGVESLTRPAPLENLAMRIVSESRDKVAARTKRFHLENQRRRGER